MTIYRRTPLALLGKMQLLSRGFLLYFFLYILKRRKKLDKFVIVCWDTVEHGKISVDFIKNFGQREGSA